MRPAVADLDARRPIWLALSDLYLDTEHRSFVRVAASELARSAYTLSELRTILFDEIHPILAHNLCVTTGVWERFDQAWLAERILAQQRRPRWLRARGRCLHRYATLLWRLLKPRIARERMMPAIDDTIPPKPSGILPSTARSAHPCAAVRRRAACRAKSRLTP